MILPFMILLIPFLTNLLALAIKNSGKLVTFDQRIDPSLLQGGISSYHVKDDSGV